MGKVEQLRVEPDKHQNAREFMAGNSWTELLWLEKPSKII